MDPAPPPELAPAHDLVALPGIDEVLPAVLLHRQPQMCRLVAEDAALMFEREQWQARRPRWWQLLRICRWHQDGLTLARRQADLSSFVAAYRADRRTDRAAAV